MPILASIRPPATRRETTSLPRLLHGLLAGLLFIALVFGHPLPCMLLLILAAAAVVATGTISCTLTSAMATGLVLIICEAFQPATAWPHMLSRFSPLATPSTIVPACVLMPIVGWFLARPKTGVTMAAGLTVTVIAVIGGLSIWPLFQAVEFGNAGDVLFTVRCMLIILAAAFSVALFRFESRNDGLRRVSRKAAVIVIAGTFAVVGWLAILPFMHHLMPASNQKVAIFWPDAHGLEHGYIAVRQGGQGLDNIGLFGELPVLLRNHGFDIVLTPVLDGPSLAEVGILCIFTPFRGLADAEVATVQAFVDRGGRLLVAAEHTNLDDNQAILNRLLEPYGVSINFDTAGSLCGNTIGGTTTSFHPLGRLFSRYPRLAYNRGASLSIDRRQSMPVLVGQSWYSDAGDDSNRDKGRMGDEVWSRGDRIGDLPVVSACEQGRGAVVVFGDTSPFINRNIPWNGGFICDLFSYLLNGSALPCSAPRRTMILSTNEGNLFSRDGFSDCSLTAVGVAALREGVPVAFGDWRRARKDDIIMVVNPTRFVNMDALFRHMASGGVAVVTGAGDNPCFVKVAEQVGCKVGNVPRGALQGDMVNDYACWDVAPLVTNGTAQVVSASGRSIGIVKRYGAGKLVLLGDEGFLWSKNLETRTSRDSKNARFISKTILGCDG